MKTWNNLKHGDKVKNVERKKCQPKLVYQMKIFFKYERGNLKQKLRQCATI